METVSLTIDGRQVSVAKGRTVLQAAIESGVRTGKTCSRKWSSSQLFSSLVIATAVTISKPSYLRRLIRTDRIF